MRIFILSLSAALLTLATGTEVLAFGRGGGGHGGGGGHAGGGAPPRGGGGGHAVFSGPVGGVHNYSPPHEAAVPHPSYVPHEATRGGEVGRGIENREAGGFGRVEREGDRGGLIGNRGGDLGANGYRGGVAIGPGGGQLGHSTSYLRPSSLHGIGNGIRGGNYPYFTRDWYGNRAGVWFPGGWFGGVDPWYDPPWDNLGPFLGIAATPIDYDYGSTAVIQDNSVYLNGEPIGTVDDYAAQAQALEDAGRTATLAPNEDWEPLGVFGLVQGNERIAQRIFQLAVNKAGIVHGNYYDAIADSTQPVFGSVDKKSQRVAWSIGDRKDIVYEAGLNNLLQPETTVLIHYGKVRTQEMILVRLNQPPKQ